MILWRGAVGGTVRFCIVTRVTAASPAPACHRPPRLLKHALSVDCARGGGPREGLVENAPRRGAGGRKSKSSYAPFPTEAQGDFPSPERSARGSAAGEAGGSRLFDAASCAGAVCEGFGRKTNCARISAHARRPPGARTGDGVLGFGDLGEGMAPGLPALTGWLGQGTQDG
jgi:hypothetical protein